MILQKKNTVIQTTTMSLVTLPVEILYRILDHVDMHSILFSFRCVCKQFYTISNSYNRYELDTSSSSSSDIKRIARLIQPDRIISLVFHADSSGENKIDLFFRCFNSNEFVRLFSLTLIGVYHYKVNHILQVFAGCARLVSLSIYTGANQSKQATDIVLSAETKFKLRKLNLKNSDSFFVNLSSQHISTVEHITLENCTFSQYQLILSSLPHLKTLTMRDCIKTDHDEMPSMSYPQLICLSINDCHLSINDIQSVISQVPSLAYLKLRSHRNHFDSAFNGSFWEKFIQTNLPSFIKFQFFFSYTMNQNDVLIDMDSLIQTFRTSFWSHNIQCDYNIQQRIINLYTTPISIDFSRSMKISVCPTISIRLNVDDSPTLSWTDQVFDITSSIVTFSLLRFILIQTPTEVKIRSHRIDDHQIKYFARALRTNEVNSN